MKMYSKMIWLLLLLLVLSCYKQTIDKKPQPNKYYEEDIRVWTLAGLVYSKDDSAKIVNSHVTLFYNDSVNNIKTVLTDNCGMYVFEGLRNRKYRIFCTAPGYLPFDSTGICTVSDTCTNILLDMDLDIGLLKKW